MSEPMFPSPDQGQAAPAMAEAVDAGGNRKALLAIGGIGAALVVGAGAFFLLNSGSSDPVAAPVPVASTGVDAAPAPAASASPSAKPATVRPASSNLTSRDPFKPLFVTVAVDTGTTTTGGSTGSTSGSTSSGGTPAPAPAPAAPTVMLTVTNVDATAQTVTVAVGTKKYNTTVNKPFGSYYNVYSVFNDQCVGILYGDQSVAVCEGNPVSVTP